MKNKVLIIFIILILLSIVWFVVRFIIGGPEDTWICVDSKWVKHGAPSAPMPTAPCGKGPVACTMEAKLCSDGSYVSRISPNCDFAMCPKEDLIIIESPKAYDEIQSPLFVKGKARGAWYFEASFPVKLFDDNGFLLGATTAQALENWMTENFVPFSATFPFAVPSTQKGKLVLEKDNPSGLPEHADELIVPVNFKEASEISQELMTVKIFLNDSRFAGEPYFDCSHTIAVERQVSKTPVVARSAIEALLRGATQEEINNGFVSNINSGVRIQKLTIDPSADGGIAKVDFDEQLEFQVGGSCRVAAIRAQIIQTLKQFSTVKEVIISISGRTEDILQP